MSRRKESKLLETACYPACLQHWVFHVGWLEMRQEPTSEVSKCHADGFGLNEAGKGVAVNGSKKSCSVRTAMSHSQKGGCGEAHGLKQSKFIEGTGPRWR